MARTLKSLLGAVAASALLVQPLLAEEALLKSKEVATFVEVMIANDCKLEEASAEELMNAAGLASEDAAAAMMVLMAGEVIEEGTEGELRLKETYCKGGVAALPADEATPLAALEQLGNEEAAQVNVTLLTQAIVEAGCRVTEANNVAILEATALTEDEAKAAVTQLIAQDKAIFEGPDLVLKTEGCE